jgi:hypothetical protein
MIHKIDGEAKMWGVVKVAKRWSNDGRPTRHQLQYTIITRPY